MEIRAPMSMKSRIILMAVCLVIAVTAGVRLYKSVQTGAVTASSDNLKLFKEVMTIVKQKYVDEVDDKKLIQGAIDGMLSKLDPHSNFMTPEPYKEMKVAMSGSFGGLGIEINLKDGKLTVISPIEDTPAWRAGIKSNDHIWKIDDKPTRGMSLQKAVSLMRGDKGTRVTLHIARDGEKKSLVFPLVRDIIKTKSMKSRTLTPGYGYVRIAQFQERSGEDFIKAMEVIHADNPSGLKGLIIDLRNNPGGLVDSAAQIADRFIGEGKEDGTIVTMKGRIQGAQMNRFAKVGQKEPHYPVVVLINGGSASASEILAGALQDNKRAIIMGTQSYGKGSVQSVIPLRDGYGLKLTTALYYTPKGRSIQAKGITPDIIVAQVDLSAKGKNGDKIEPEDSSADFREKDLQKMFKGDDKADRKPAMELQAPAKKPAEKPQSKGITLLPANDELANDYQLARALEMLKGLDIFNAVTRGTPAAVPPAPPAGAAAK
jgi:carboxyl-terminal processing protease